MDKSLLKPLYQELQGYLSQTPLPKDLADFTSEKSVWEQYNQTVDILSDTTNEDFARFKVTPEGDEYPSLNITGYRQKVGGFISFLHAKYFSDEQAPFSGGPKTVITQQQQQDQSQNVYLQILLDLQSKIDKNLDKYEEGTKEKGFLKTLKEQLSTATNAFNLISLILKLANEFGLNPADILKALNL